MFKTILKIVVAIILTITICAVAQAQDFDRVLEKDIKTEINLNRIAKSQNPLYLSSFYKAAADSINKIAYKSYLDNTVENTLGIQEDWEKIWSPVDEQFSKYFASYNIVVIKDGDYTNELRKYRNAYFYKLENSEMSLSAIRHDNKIFLTVLTW